MHDRQAQRDEGADLDDRRGHRRSPVRDRPDSSSFKDDLEFQSIQFIALAAQIQERYDHVDFVTWLSAKDLAAVIALRVGDVADFILASS